MVLIKAEVGVGFCVFFNCPPHQCGPILPINTADVVRALPSHPKVWAISSVLVFLKSSVNLLFFVIKALKLTGWPWARPSVNSKDFCKDKMKSLMMYTARRSLKGDSPDLTGFSDLIKACTTAGMLYDSNRMPLAISGMLLQIATVTIAEDSQH